MMTAKESNGLSDEELARRLQRQEVSYNSQQPLGAGGAYYYQSYLGTDGPSAYQTIPERAGPGTIPLQYGASFAPTMQGTQVYVGERERLMLDCHRLSRGVRYISMIDAAILLLFGSTMLPQLLVMLWGPLCGYLASGFRLKFAYFYLGYYVLRVAFDLAWLATPLPNFWWMVMALMVDFLLARYIYMFLRLLRQCSSIEISVLRSPGSIWAQSSAQRSFLVC